MDPSHLIRSTMLRIQAAHERHAATWRRMRREHFPDISAIQAVQNGLIETMWQANAMAYAEARPYRDETNRLLRVLFERYVEPDGQALARGEPQAVDRVIDFLETDVPAFRCGYAKEEYIKRLRSMPLDARQRQRLMGYTLDLCRNPLHRREIKWAGRLMIRLAGQPFIDQLRGLTQDGNRRVAAKSGRMLEVVLHSRKDLHA
jgi:hypothetical protein